MRGYDSHVPYDQDLPGSLEADEYARDTKSDPGKYALDESYEYARDTQSDPGKYALSEEYYYSGSENLGYYKGKYRTQ